MKECIWCLFALVAALPAAAAVSEPPAEAPLQVGHERAAREVIFGISNPSDAPSPACRLLLEVGNAAPRPYTVPPVPPRSSTRLRHVAAPGQDLRYWPLRYRLEGRSAACRGHTVEDLPPQAAVSIGCGPAAEQPRTIVVRLRNASGNPAEGGSLEVTIHLRAEARSSPRRAFAQISPRTETEDMPIVLGPELPAGLSAKDVHFEVVARGANFATVDCKHSPS